jgi:putative redox protein
VPSAYLEWIDGHQLVAVDEGGQAIVIDAPGEGETSWRGFKPVNLLLASLAGCTAYDIVDILRKGRQRLTDLRIKVEGSQEPEPPWAFTEIRIEYLFRGHDLDEKRVRRAVELAETKYCSVGATISGRARIVSSFHIEPA